ncbi:hypothetical protein SLA2020_398470 [Shorea laevis]
MDRTGCQRWTSDRKKLTEKYTAAVSSRGARWVAFAYALIASHHSLNGMLKSSICLGFSGDSQSRSIPSNPTFRATSKAELMKALRQTGVDTMSECNKF